MKGTVGVESVYHKGTTFRVKIPFEKAQGQAQQVDKLSYAVSPSTEGTVEKIIVEESEKLILLVEDNLVNQMILKNIFSKIQLKFEIASNGLQALRMFEDHPNRYSIILMVEFSPIM